MHYDPTAKKIAEVGLAMAKAMGAEVFLVHVVEDLVAYSLQYLNTGSLQLDTEIKSQDAYQFFLEKIRHNPGDMMLRAVVNEGNFADAILQTAKELDIDIIVMGSHSKKWLEKIVMGSVTEAVLRKTTIPLFIVPTRNSKQFIVDSLQIL